MSVYKPKGSPYWHFDFQINGVRFHGSSGTASKEAAKRIEAAQRNKAALSPYTPETNEMKLRAAIGAYWQNHAQFKKSARDIEIKLERLMERLGPNNYIGRIRNSDITDYISKRREEVGPASVNREIVLLRACFIHCDKKLDATVPKLNWEDHFLDEPKGRTRSLSHDEEKRLFENLRPDFHLLVKFSLLVGCRVSSARKLTWADIKDGTIRFSVKSEIEGDFRELPVTDLIQEILDQVKGHHPIYVFTYQCAKHRTIEGQVKRQKGERYPFSANGWTRAWRRTLKAAKILDFVFHDLRHTAATRTLRKEKNLALVQKILGHKDIASTLRYAHVDMDDISAALSRNSPKKEAEAAAVGEETEEKSVA